jgi:prepilin-type N-terminal cleavage/methylation domain-containing protein
MKSKAFTIIEVLVAVIILASVATALFQISINSKNNFSFYQKKFEYENLSSLSLFSKTISNSNLYEQIRTRYNIKDDDLRRRLKNIKLKKKIKEISTKKIEKISFKIDQIQIFSKDGSSIYHQIGLK